MSPKLHYAFSSLRSRWALSVLSWLFGGVGISVASDPEPWFRQPPKEVRPEVLWMWMGSNISSRGITRDLEALKDAGYGGATLFSLADTCTPWAGVIANSPTPNIVAFTDPWWELIRQAATKAKQLGLNFGIHNCPGYESSGGPWITPERSMQELVWSELPVHGPTSFSAVLPRAQPDLHAVQPYPVFNPTTSRLEKPEIPARRSYYRDIAVLALPATGSVTPGQVVNLTAHLSASGALQWEVPEGDWIIYRFGHTTMGKLLQPGQWEAIGLECDKMSREAVEFHLNHIIGEAKRHLGSLVGDGFNYYHFDSYEAGVPTWTPAMGAEFLNRRGYDLTAFLPTFAKREIGSEEERKKFQADFQQTIRDLYRENYFPVIAAALHKAGLKFMCEPYGGPWSIDEVVPVVDRIVTEFWTRGGKYDPFLLEPTVKAVRTAHRNVIEAEAFTGAPADSAWTETPAWLKAIGDAAFCDGVNRFCLHRFVHQPFDDRYQPGLAMGQWGTHFDRTQTWWEPGKAWVQYLTRCQALLQWGAVVEMENDFAAVPGEGAIRLRALHRRDGGTDLYFVANLAREAGTALCSYPVVGYQPELWDPVAGTIRDLPDFQVGEGRTVVPMAFAPSQSFFVVFRKPAAPSASTRATPTSAVNFPPLEVAVTFSQPWTVQFNPAWGGPKKMIFEELEDWTARPEPGIKYYSGTARYDYTFTTPATFNPKNSRRLWLDLGDVRHLARVSLNGRDLGTLWTAPWRVEVTGLLKTGRNIFVVQVTNTWANRLIGDEQAPADLQWGVGDHGFGGPLKSFPDWFIKKQPRPSGGRYTFTTWNYFTPLSPLQASGLLGPVTLQVLKP